MGYTPKHAKPDSLDDATTDGSPGEQSATGEPSPGRHAADDIQNAEDKIVPEPRTGDS